MSSINIVQTLIKRLSTKENIQHDAEEWNWNIVGNSLPFPVRLRFPHFENKISGHTEEKQQKPEHVGATKFCCD